PAFLLRQHTSDMRPLRAINALLLNRPVVIANSLLTAFRALLMLTTRCFFTSRSHGQRITATEPRVTAQRNGANAAHPPCIPHLAWSRPCGRQAGHHRIERLSVDHEQAQTRCRA